MTLASSSRRLGPSGSGCSGVRIWIRWGKEAVQGGDFVTEKVRGLELGVLGMVHGLHQSEKRGHVLGQADSGVSVGGVGRRSFNGIGHELVSGSVWGIRRVAAGRAKTKLGFVD